MVTDDERREVAESLRYAADYPGFPVRYMEQFIEVLREIIFSDVCSGADYREMFQRLAGLIDLGESGHESGQNLDAVPMKSPAVQKAPETCEHWLDGECYALRTARPVEREALLAEAKEAEKSAWYFALDHDENELRDRLAEAAEDFSDMARRIREACGEVDG